jgi:phage FluMu protein Com
MPWLGTVRPALILVALHNAARDAVLPAMSIRSREVIWGGRIIGAKMRAESAREEAYKAIRAADRAEAEAWSVRMEGYGGPAQPSPTIGQCIHGGLGWLEVECHRCKTRASLPLNAIRRPRDTPLWKLEASLKCPNCRRVRRAPSVHMIKLTERQEITPYKWVHPSEER